MDRYPYYKYTILLGATRALAHIGIHFTHRVFRLSMVVGSSISPHVLEMKGYLYHLEKLGLSISQELATDIILQTLPDAYDGFVMNYNRHNMEKTNSELHRMLKTVE